MKLGIENTPKIKSVLQNKRVGLVTNHTGVNSWFVRTQEIIENNGGKVVRLFTPEHGIFGISDAGEAVASSRNLRNTCDIVSLYGDHKSPSPEEVKDLDLLTFDIQDVGVRYYTYISTLYEVLKVAEKCQRPIVVFDRPLPLGRQSPLGLTLQKRLYSFVGVMPLPNRYGLTIGELSEWIRDRDFPALELTVVPMQGWDPNKTIIENGLPWVSPSPNIVTLDALRLYPGLCFLEGTNVSEGRGTVRPFEQLGAPWIDGTRLAAVLNQNANQDGRLRFQPTRYKPLASKFKDELCQGIQIHIFHDDFNPLLLGFDILARLLDLYPTKFDTSLRSPDVGERHTMLEYLSGLEMKDGTSIENARSTACQINLSFAKQVQNYYRY